MVTKEFAIAKRMPVRMKGIVAGNATCRKICPRLAPSERAARILLGATADTPAAVLMMTMNTVV